VNFHKHFNTYHHQFKTYFPKPLYQGGKSEFIFQNLAVKVNVDSIKLKMENLLLIKTLTHSLFGMIMKIWKTNLKKIKRENKELKSLFIIFQVF